MLLDEVHEAQLRRAAVNHATYKALFEKASAKIRQVAGMSRAHTRLHFRVPPFVWGRPPFKHEHAVRYVSEKLRRNGFGVHDLGGGVLEVRWHAARPRARRRSGAEPPRQPHQPSQPSQPSHQPQPQPRPERAGRLSARLAALRQHFD